jgi:hypothetical protein
MSGAKARSGPRAPVAARATLATRTTLTTLALLVACGHQSATAKAADRRGDEARALARRAGLSAAVGDVLARYAASVGRTYTATYAVGPTTVVLAQRPPDRRVEVTNANGSRAVRIDTAKGSTTCVWSGTRWACEPAGGGAPTAVGPLDPAAVQRTVQTLASSRATYAFAVDERVVAKTRARCLEVSPRPGAPADAHPATLCVSPEGALLLLEGTATPLRATSYSTHVDDKSFRRPT